MAKKKNFTPQEQERIRKRIEFVQANPELAPAEARKRFFVQTRVQELSAAGKPVDRKKLRQQFTSGNVKRKGFYTEGDLQKIAAQKAASSKSTPTDVTNNAGSTAAKKVNVAGPIVRAGVGQAPKNLAQVKKEDPNQLAEDIAYMREKGIYKTALGQIKADGSMTPLGKFFYKIGEATVGSLESLQATFVNPAINLAGEGLNKLSGNKPGGGNPNYNPRLRTAGPKEAAFNTAMTLIDIAAAGSASATRAALGPTVSGAIKSGRGLTAPGKSVGPRGPGKSMSTYRNPAEGRGMTYRTATPAEEVKFPGLTPTKVSKPKATTKPKAVTKTKTTKASRATAKAQADIQAKVDEMIKTGVSNATSKPTKVKTTTKAKSSAPVSKGDSQPTALANLLNGPGGRQTTRTTTKAATKAKPKAEPAIPGTVKINETTYMVGKTESGLPSYSRVNPDMPAPAKPVAKKPTRKQVQRRAKQVTEQKPVVVKSNTPSDFKTQAEYNDWLRKGGKEQLRNMTQVQRDVFMSKNKKFIQGRAQEVKAQAESVAKAKARKEARNRRYRNARPELQALYNRVYETRTTDAALRLAKLKGLTK